MNIHEKCFDYLAQVSGLQEQLQKQKQQIQAAKYKTVGRKQFIIPEEQKQAMIHNAVTRCNKLCNSIYETMNRERVENNLPEFENPYID